MVALVIAVFITILVVVVYLKRRRADKVKEGESVTTRLINTCQIYSLRHSVRPQYSGADTGFENGEGCPGNY